MDSLDWVGIGFLVLFTIRVCIDPRVMRAGVYLLGGIVSIGFSDLVRLATQARNISFDGLTYFILGTLLLTVLVTLVLSVMLVLNGIVMLRREGRRLSTLLSLLLGLIIFAEMVWGVVMFYEDSTPMFMVAVIFIVPSLYLGFGFLAYLLYSACYQQFSKRQSKKVKAVVVLGSGLIAGRVPPLLASRLDTGVKVYNRRSETQQDTLIVVSGGQGKDESRSEAAAMAEYLIEKGIPSDHILTEDRSTNTKENLLNTRDVLKQHEIDVRTSREKIAVVTNNFHAFRSALLMRKVKIPGFAIGAPTANYYWPSASIREYVAILRDSLWIHIVLLSLIWLPVIYYVIWYLATHSIPA